MQTLSDIFPIRTCKRDLKEGHEVGRPCLNYQIGRCLAPCRGCVPKSEYHAMMQQAAALLSVRAGRSRRTDPSADAAGLRRASVRKGGDAARPNDQRGDRAAKTDCLRRQGTTTATSSALRPGGGRCVVQVLFMRGGRIKGSEQLEMRQADDASTQEIVENFLLQYYESATTDPARDPRAGTAGTGGNSGRAVQRTKRAARLSSLARSAARKNNFWIWRSKTP